LIIAVLAFLKWRSRMGTEALDYLLRNTLVIQYQFWPGLMASFASFVVCVKVGENEAKAVYPWMDHTCDNAFDNWWIFVMLCWILVLAAGPVWWIWLIWQQVVDDSEVDDDSKWTRKRRAEVLGFLVSGYREGWEVWEAWVLLRRCLVETINIYLSPTLLPSPNAITVSTLLVGATGFHATVLPYDEAQFLEAQDEEQAGMTFWSRLPQWMSPSLNGVELCTSSISGFCLFLVAIELAGTTWKPPWQSTLSLVTVAVLVLGVTVFLGVKLAGLGWSLMRDAARKCQPHASYYSGD